MFCKYCGAQLMDGAVFCHACGKATAEVPAQPVAPVCPQPVPPVQPVYRAPVQPAPPVQPVYQAPVQQPVYQPPVQPQPVYQAPVQPQPVYQAPVQTMYTAPAQPVYPQPAQPPMDPALEAKQKSQTLTFGILGLSLSILGVPGIIFSSIAAKKASDLKKQTGLLTGKARTGYKLAKAGKIISIILTVLWTLFLPTILNDILSFFDNPFEYFSF